MVPCSSSYPSFTVDFSFSRFLHISLSIFQWKDADPEKLMDAELHMVFENTSSEVGSLSVWNAVSDSKTRARECTF